MDFKIEHGIPYGNRGETSGITRRMKDLYESMSPGDSVLLPGSSQSSHASAFRKVAKRAGGLAVTQEFRPNVRVWRVA